MKQIGEMLVVDYMSEQAIVVDNTAKLTEAIRVMENQRLSAVPVVDEQGKLIGILSTGDLISMVHEIQSDISAMHLVNQNTREFLIKLLMDQGDNVRVADVMTSPVETIAPEMNLVLAAQKMAERKYHHFPVVDEAGVAVGILSSSDFVRAIADNGALATR